MSVQCSEFVGNMVMGTLLLRHYQKVWYGFSIKGQRGKEELVRMRLPPASDPAQGQTPSNAHVVSIDGERVNWTRQTTRQLGS